jgi:hypothetical protein
VHYKQVDLQVVDSLQQVDQIMEQVVEVVWDLSVPMRLAILEEMVEMEQPIQLGERPIHSLGEVELEPIMVLQDQGVQEVVVQVLEAQIYLEGMQAIMDLVVAVLLVAMLVVVVVLDGMDGLVNLQWQEQQIKVMRPVNLVQDFFMLVVEEVQAKLVVVTWTQLVEMAYQVQSQELHITEQVVVQVQVHTLVLVEVVEEEVEQEVIYTFPLFLLLMVP